VLLVKVTRMTSKSLHFTIHGQHFVS
jgi:hypothetical protein